jgi:hypothetical protein
MIFLELVSLLSIVGALLLVYINPKGGIYMNIIDELKFYETVDLLGLFSDLASLTRYLIGLGLLIIMGSLKISALVILYSYYEGSSLELLTFTL